MCLACHSPHGSNYPGLLKTKPATLCLNCHPDIENSVHFHPPWCRHGVLPNLPRQFADPSEKAFDLLGRNSKNHVKPYPIPRNISNMY
ncbi:MAG: hypothetical protein COZ09_06490 [Comamonadaceae bacterium CG_4_10_14_3_um_filter_60_42]|nr:MAG: hypothetical protein COZ09_06490 [Comamonadaceae bacterium CG_4_10_14_3_um_filter_60_42]